MSNQTAKRGLSVKDLVTIGIFTALMLVFSMVGGIFFAPNPVLTFYMPVGSAILCGPIYLLLIAKVKKRFAITIVGALIGIIWFVTGMHWAFALGTILMGIVADLVAGIGGYAIQSRWNRLLSRLFCRPGRMGKDDAWKRNGAGLYRYDAGDRKQCHSRSHADRNAGGGTDQRGSWQQNVKKTV